MLAALVHFLIRIIPWLSYDYRHRRVKRKQVCPACGNRVRVQMEYDPKQRLLVCVCPLDGARWGYNPVVKDQTWAKPPEE